MTLPLKSICFLLITLGCFLWSASLLFGASPKKLHIITTLFPTYDFARQIGKDRVRVTSLIPPGLEPHDFEPTPKDIINIHSADVFIYTGKNMEPWVHDVLQSIQNKNVLIVDASQGILSKSMQTSDPHIWLDLTTAQKMTQTIADAFAKKDPLHKKYYLAHAKAYQSKLADMDRQFIDTFSSCTQKKIFCAGHIAFGHFATRYGLSIQSVYTEFAPNAEPSPKQLHTFITSIKKLSIPVVYYEELIDPKIARLISEETGAQILLLNGAHNVSKQELHEGITYLDIMHHNLSVLKKGLHCQ